MKQKKISSIVIMLVLIITMAFPSPAFAAKKASKSTTKSSSGTKSSSKSSKSSSSKKSSKSSSSKKSSKSSTSKSSTKSTSKSNKTSNKKNSGEGVLVADTPKSNKKSKKSSQSTKSTSSNKKKSSSKKSTKGKSSKKKSTKGKSTTDKSKLVGIYPSKKSTKGKSSTDKSKLVGTTSTSSTKKVKVSSVKSKYTMTMGKTKKLKPKTNVKCTIKYKSSDPSVVTVKNGKLVALKPGQAIITITATAKDKKLRKTANGKSVTTHLVTVKNDGSYGESANKNGYQEETIGSAICVIPIEQLVPNLDKRFVDALNYIGFKFYVTSPYPDNGSAASSVLNLKERSLTIKEGETDLLYENLGLILAFISGNADRSSDFLYVYNKEKENCADFREQPKNSSDYFAKAFSSYMKDSALSQSLRPETNKRIEHCMNKLSMEHMNKIMETYRKSARKPTFLIVG